MSNSMLRTKPGVSMTLPSINRTAVKSGLCVMSALLLLPGTLFSQAKPAHPVKAQAWYQKATAMTSEGRLTFLDQPWWPRAQKLVEGQSFTLDLNADGRPDTIIIRRDGNIVEAIDDSGHASDIWNTADTAYVVSYKGTGVVDRMVVYTDNNHDDKADEMEIRYYKEGYLRYAWFGENYDNDGAQIFHLTNWGYDGKQFESKFRGNVMIYVNKYDPVSQSWVPLSECPFAFYDPNHDGLGEIVLRAAAQASEVSHGNALDNANSYGPMWQDEPLHLKDMVLANMRLSYNIDPEPRTDGWKQPHYNFGFTMVGDTQYRFPMMRYTNPRRRAPQAVIRMNWGSAVQDALKYRASATGFSWDESRDVRRWEGQFWIYERRILANTGGPVQRWNMRREYSSAATASREIYYSGVDKRFHLKGASEMWLEVGHVIGDSKEMEIRAYDTDRDGYLDTWEVYREGQAVPARVTQVSNPQARVVALDRKSMMADYNGRVLPDAIKENQRLIAALKKVAVSSEAAKYEEAATNAPMMERRRYCLDIARELYFLAARDALYARNAAGDYPTLAQATVRNNMNRGPIDGRYTIKDTLDYWTLARGMGRFVRAYGEGRFAEAQTALDELAPAAHEQ